MNINSAVKNYVAQSVDNFRAMLFYTPSLFVTPLLHFSKESFSRKVHLSQYCKQLLQLTVVATLAGNARGCDVV